MTSRSIRRSASRAAPAAATACCSTSAIRRIRFASTPWPTPISRTGTRRRSTTTAPRSSSPTSGAAAGSRSAARPTRRSGARTRSSRSSNSKLQFQSYYKMPAPQTPQENCVAHNGSLIPIPGRDVMVQAWYQGGISVFDWTDAAHPQGDRLLRSRPGRLDPDGDRRIVVGVLVQRRDRELGDLPRSRHLRADAERDSSRRTRSTRRRRCTSTT